MQVSYFVYKTTNLVNNKFYIGKHQTRNNQDGYLGSGKLLKRAISRYGRENFSFEILEFFEDEESLNKREAEIVTEEFCRDPQNYNLCVGGRGGFSYINRNGLNCNSKNSPEIRKKCADKIRGIPRPWVRENNLKLHQQGLLPKVKANGSGNSAEARAKKSASHKARFLAGAVNSQTGTCWITNGTINKKIKVVDLIPEGWYKGRILNNAV